MSARGEPRSPSLPWVSLGHLGSVGLRIAQRAQQTQRSAVLVCVQRRATRGVRRRSQQRQQLRRRRHIDRSEGPQQLPPLPMLGRDLMK